METVMASVYAANTQPICRSPPRSATIEGSAVATMVASMADRRVTTTRATNSRRRWAAGREDEGTGILEVLATRPGARSRRRATTDGYVLAGATPTSSVSLADRSGFRWFST